MLKYLLYITKFVLGIFGADLPLDSTTIDFLDQLCDTVLENGSYFKQLLQLLKIRIKSWWKSHQSSR